jgi:exopolysaccharide production protein ExoZ
MATSSVQSNVRQANSEITQTVSQSTSSSSTVLNPGVTAPSQPLARPTLEGNALTRFLAHIYELSDESNRFPSMEGIRGLAILLVFFVHYHTLFSPYVTQGSVTFRISQLSWGLGQSGVDLFFVLSGYLIYGAVIRRPINYLKFMERRVQRIYPTFLSVFALYLVLCVAFPTASKLPSGGWPIAKYILMNLALLPGIVPMEPLIKVAWSLSYEFFFYLTIPLLVMATSMRKWERWHRVAFFLTLAALRFTIAPILPIRMVMFTGGILVYEALHSEWLRARLTALGETVVTAIFLASFVPIALLAIQHGPPSSAGGWSGNLISLREFVMWFSFSLFVVYCLGRQGILGRVFSWTPLRWMGNMSYSYYLIHGVTLQGFKLVCQRIWPMEGGSPLLFWALLLPAIFATLVTSTLLFCFVEKPFSLQKHISVAKKNSET